MKRVSCLFALAVSFLWWPPLAQGGSSIVAWGNNNWSQANVPSGLNGLIAVAAADDHSFALGTNGIPVQWGATAEFAAADPRYKVPSDLINAIAISSGADPFNLALTDRGIVRAWGGNDYGCSTVPAGLSNVVAIAAGYVHSLALKRNGTVVAWGDNSSGQTNVPSWLNNVVAISAGEFHSLALRDDGTVVGWGANSLGEAIGTPTYSPYITNGVVTIQGTILSNIVAIAAGVDHFGLGLRRDGTVVSWGQNFSGHLTPPANLSNAVAISAGLDFAIALKADGTVVAWGIDVYGATYVPPGLSNVVAVAAGLDHCIALQGNGSPVVVPIFTNPHRDAAGFRVAFSTKSGHVYAPEHTDSLTDIHWTRLPLIAGSGGVVTLMDSTATNVQRFYRVRSW